MQTKFNNTILNTYRTTPLCRAQQSQHAHPRKDYANLQIIDWWAQDIFIIDSSMKVNSKIHCFRIQIHHIRGPFPAEFMNLSTGRIPKTRPLEHLVSFSQAPVTKGAFFKHILLKPGFTGWGRPQYCDIYLCRNHSWAYDHQQTPSTRHT